mgnify:CR=1 FL=1
MDLDLYGGKDADKKEITQVGLKENIKNAGKTADDDDEVETGDPKEDVTDADEGAKSGAAESPATKLGGALSEATEPTEPVKRNDYSLLDMITGFLYEEEDPLPILCGYFCKIMDQLMDKQKARMLEYLLVEQNGKIFSGLLNHLQHHSLATFLIHLIEVQISSEKKENKWDTSDNSDADGDHDAEPELSAEQKHMQAVLREKSNMVVDALIDALSAKNQDDLQLTLNASTVLSEFADNETLFALLTSEKNLAKLVCICGEMDANSQNLPYALNLLTSLLNQLNECETSFFKNGKEQTLALLTRHSTDILYNCLIILRAGATDVATARNQSGKPYRRVGMLRIRAIEQMRTLFAVLSKQGYVKDPTRLSVALRKKVIETMLFMLRAFEFCSISHQQAIQILNFVREAFDEDDLATMKRFVQEELSADTMFHFPSGKRTSRTNMGQICKIAFELRNFTQQALDDEDSGEGSDDEDPVSIQKRSELQGWFSFCREKVDKIEEVWNHRLDQPRTPVEEPAPEPTKADDFNFADQDHEKTIEDLLSNFNPGKIASRPSAPLVKSEQDKDLLNDIMAGRKDEAKDDFAVEYKTGAYGDNQFWETPQMYDIDELLAEQDQ